MFKKAVFELVQQFHHATENGNVAIAVSACAHQLQQTKQRQFRMKRTIVEHMRSGRRVCKKW